MAMKSSLKNMVLVLFCITFISAACVGAVNMITEEPIAKAKAANLVAVDGLAMLFYQGKSSFTLWTGSEPQVTYQQFLGEIQ